MTTIPGSNGDVLITRQRSIPFVKMTSGTIIDNAILIIENHIRKHEYRVRLYNSNLSTIIEEIAMPFSSKNYAVNKFNGWRNKLDQKSRDIADDINKDLAAKAPTKKFG